MTSPVQITLPESLKIAQAHALHDELEALLNKPDSEEIVINAKKVEAIDTAGLQLVMSLVKTAKEAHMTIAWDGISDRFRDAAQMIGLHTALELN